MVICWLCLVFVSILSFLQAVVGVADVEVCPLCVVLYNIAICGTK